MKEKSEGVAFDLDKIISNIPEDNYWVDFIKTKHLEAGILRLLPGEKDTQTPHESDELYFVIEGKGFLKMGSKDMPVKKGSIAFVPANLPHHFYGNDDGTLVALYVFSE